MTQSGTYAGEWAPVPLADGTTRYDWVPAEQPASPDGTPGAWHVVTGADGVGSWVWFPAPPGLFRSDEPVAPPVPAAEAPKKKPQLPAVLQDRRVQLGVGALVLLALLWVVFTGGDSAGGRAGTSTLPEGEKQSRLETAANGYIAALMSGNGTEAAKFLDPQSCREADKKAAADFASFLKSAAPGATAKAGELTLAGDDGNVHFQLTSSAPDAVKGAIEGGWASGGEFSWHLRNDQWFFDAEC